MNGVFSSDHPNLQFLSDGTRVEFQKEEGTWRGILEKPNGKLRQVGIVAPVGVKEITHLYAFQEQFYLIGLSADRKAERCFRSPDLKSWELVGRHEWEKGAFAFSIDKVLPSKGKRFLILTRPMETWQKERGVTLLWAHLEGGRFVPEGSVPLTYEGQPLIQPGVKGDRSRHWLLGLVDAVFSQAAVLCGEHLVFLSKERGVFWVVDPETGRVRMLKLHKGLESHHVKDNASLNPIVANVCPAPDGSLWIAARPRKGALLAFEPPEGIAGKDLGKPFDTWARDNLMKHPEIQWWRLDPSAASLEPMAEPAGNLPTTLETPGKWYAFKFRVMANGTCQLVR